MIINHNITALNTHRQMSSATNAQANSMEKLSSGLRINSAKDDAAGLSISEKMRGQIRGLEQAGRNAQDGISMLQTAEGALNETHSILQRMSELATQGANGSLQAEDRAAITEEITQLNSEINRISSSTNFNGKNLLDGSFGVQLDTTATTGTGIQTGSDGVTAIDISGAKANTTFTVSFTAGDYTLDDGNGNTQTVTLADGTAGTLNFDKLGVKVALNGEQLGASLTTSTAGGGAAGTIKTGAQADVNIQIGSGTTDAEKLGVSIRKMNSDADSLNTGAISVATDADARAAMDIIKTAINTVSAERSKLGANQNRLDHTINNLNTSSENLTSAESRIRDVDYAEAA